MTTDNGNRTENNQQANAGRYSLIPPLSVVHPVAFSLTPAVYKACTWVHGV